MDFWSSDPHHGHKNVIDYCKRPFSNVDEMTEALIKNWNSVVGPDDRIYLLGDVAFLNKHNTEEVLKQLQGRKFLIKGNHDNKDNVMAERNQKYFEWIKDYYELKVDDPDAYKGQQLIVMSHFPMLTWHKSGGKYNAWHVHGHCHGAIQKLNENTTRYDVGVDTNNYTPISYLQLKEKLKDIKYIPVDYHGVVE